MPVFGSLLDLERKFLVLSPGISLLFGARGRRNSGFEATLPKEEGKSVWQCCLAKAEVGKGGSGQGKNGFSYHQLYGNRTVLSLGWLSFGNS